MKTIIKRPHTFFWVSVPILILGGVIHTDAFYYLSVSNYIISIRGVDLAILAAIVFEFIGIGYYHSDRNKKQLSRIISTLHIVVSGVGVAMFFICTVCALTKIMVFGVFIGPLLLVMLLAQFLFAINYLWGVYKTLG
ncbi:hypothetical protein NBRC110019_10480 [Neptunitalea chrysea]|uniref:Uncharacterized protein n=1 Tax=Neptunitalea chrysea TaxID=1647581 RepID=A0A9W6EU17_9FLAO|nr:hypothetical protein [Neptunitalea chrysea]GLB52009.1 hypothetical protein NBRC110019_10480 [Neptunitalea chrysea]